MRRIITAAAVLLATLVAAPAAPSAATPAPWVASGAGTTAFARAVCLARSTITTVSGVRTTQYGRASGPFLANGSTIDMRTASWKLNPGTLVPGPRPGDAIDPDYGEAAPHHWAPGLTYPFFLDAVSGQRSNLCLVGGRFWSDIPDRHLPDDPGTPYNDTNWDTWGWEILWHRTTAVAIHTSQAWLVDTEVEQMGDGIDFNGRGTQSWRLQGVHLREIHDDCVENDQHTTGVIDDSLLDGCFMAFASQSRTSFGSTADTVTISNSLVRLQPMEASYKPLKYGHPNESGFFKLDNAGWTDPGPEYPAVTITNSVFMANDASLSNNGGISMPPDLDCTNATLVWTGAPPPTNPAPDSGWDRARRCFDDDGVAPFGEQIITDESYWDDAVAAWTASRTS